MRKAKPRRNRQNKTDGEKKKQEIGNHDQRQFLAIANPVSNVLVEGEKERMNIIKIHNHEQCPHQVSFAANESLCN